MITAVLTMDDGPSRLTVPLMKYLNDNGIQPVFFFVGEHIKSRFDDAVQVVKEGAIIGNHTMTHPWLDKCSFEEAMEEIEETDCLIEQVYQAAGVKREVKLFRFPYGVHEGETFQRLQEYLREHGYWRVDDRACTQEWYEKQEFKKYLDVGITFSFDEWRTHDEEDFRLPEILAHIEERHPEDGIPLLEQDTHHIIVLHDHEETDDIIPDYYKTILNYVMNHGVHFVAPTFIR